MSVSLQPRRLAGVSHDLPGVGRRDPLAPRRKADALLKLFANGERGFLFDRLGDLSTQFTTSRGHINAANDGDPVGLAFDRSQFSGKSAPTILSQQPNKVRNPSAAGFVAGTPGVPPTYWSIPTMPGINPQIIGLVTLGGITGLAVRYQGTTNAAGFASPAFEHRSSIPAAIGSFWRFAIYMALIGGSLTNIQNLTLRIGQNNSAFNYVTEVGSGNNIKDIITGSPLRYEFSGIADNATLATVQPYFQIPNSTTGQVVDFTLFMALPELITAPGNHGWQHDNASWRPFWKANSGKPYWLYDGADDRTKTPFKLTPAFTGAMAVRYNSVTLAKFAMGGGTLADRRFAMGISSTGTATFGWGATNTLFPSAVITGQDVVMLATGDAANRQFWLDGVLLESAAPTGLAFNETGDPLILGAFTTGGTATNFADCRIYGALALSRKVTPDEVATITQQLKRTYQ